MKIRGGDMQDDYEMYKDTGRRQRVLRVRQTRLDTAQRSGSSAAANLRGRCAAVQPDFSSELAQQDSVCTEESATRVPLNESGAHHRSAFVSKKAKKQLSMARTGGVGHGRACKTTMTDKHNANTDATMTDNTNANKFEQKVQNKRRRKLERQCRALERRISKELGRQVAGYEASLALDSALEMAGGHVQCLEAHLNICRNELAYCRGKERGAAQSPDLLSTVNEDQNMMTQDTMAQNVMAQDNSPGSKKFQDALPYADFKRFDATRRAEKKRMDVKRLQKRLQDLVNPDSERLGKRGLQRCALGNSAGGGPKSVAKKLRARAKNYGSMPDSCNSPCHELFARGGGGLFGGPVFARRTNAPTTVIKGTAQNGSPSHRQQRIESAMFRRFNKSLWTSPSEVNCEAAEYRAVEAVQGSVLEAVDERLGLDGRTADDDCGNKRGSTAHMGDFLPAKVWVSDCGDDAGCSKDPALADWEKIGNVGIVFSMA